MSEQATRERDIDAALETASNCRVAASQFRQMGFATLANWHLENAKAAEKWAAKPVRGGKGKSDG